MKTKIISTLKKELLIIETPLNVKDVIFNKGDNSLTWETDHLIISGYDLDDYTLLSKPAEIKEEDAMELVELFSIQSGRFKDYLRPECGYKTVTESLLSALETVIFWDVNPLGDEPIKYYTVDFYGNPRISRTWSEWYKTELSTFDRNRSIILVKN